jgi:hypothetical protein
MAARNLLDVSMEPVTERRPTSPKSARARDILDVPMDPTDNRQGFAGQPGPVLAEWYEEDPDTADRPKYLGELPQQTMGRIETNPETGKKEYVEGPGKIRAEFTDQPAAGRVSAQGLARAHKDTARLGKQGLAGGTLQGATFGFADELAAGVDALRGEGNYRDLRDENRRAFADAQAGDPGAYATGQLVGGAATVALPGVGMAGQGKSLLSMGNVARGAGYGAMQAAGESTADVASGDSGELGRFALDVGKGGAAGAAVTAGLGLAGKGVGKAGRWFAGSPERQTTRADDALWQLLTRGADKAKREELAGVLGSDRGAVLYMARSNPAFMEAIKRGDKAAAAEMVLAAAPEVAARKEAAIAASEAKTADSRKIYGNPIVAEMEKRRDVLRATPTPENMTAADKWQKRIDAINEAWMPAPKAPDLKGKELASRLTASADTGTRERAAANAADFGKIAEKYKLGKGVDNLAERQKKIDDALETLNGKTATIYERAGRKVAKAESDDGAIYWRVQDKGFPLSKKHKSTTWGEDDVDPLVHPGTSAVPEIGQLGKVGPNLRFGGGAGGDVEIVKFTGRQVGKGWDGEPIVIPVKELGRYVKPNVSRLIDLKLSGVKAEKDLLSSGWGKAPAQRVIGGAEESANDIYVANISGKLREWADELRKQRGALRLKDAENVEAYAQRLAEDAADNGPTMTAKELRKLITDVQGKAFAGSYLDPTEARSMQRELAGRLRAALDEHVATHGSPADVKKLAELNKEISALITFQESAEREGVKAFSELHKAGPALPAAPDTRNGRATVAQLYRLIQSTTDPEAKRVLTGELYRQIGPEATQRLTGIEREESLLERLGTVTKTGAEQYAGDSERGWRLGHMFNHYHPIASTLAKYGEGIADKANAFAVRAENLRRRGASVGALRALGRSMGIGAEVAEDIIRVLAPKGAGAQAVRE